jgi:hypothetical protein
MAEHAIACWEEVSGFAGFSLFLPAVAGAADPCTEVMA